MRVGALAGTHPAVAELDLNPVIATPDGALVVDARVRLEAPAARGRVPVAQAPERPAADYGTAMGGSADGAVPARGVA